MYSFLLLYGSGILVCLVVFGLHSPWISNHSSKTGAQGTKLIRCTYPSETNLGLHVISCILYIYHGPPKPAFLEVFMVNNLVFRWPKPLFFMVWGPMVYIYIYQEHMLTNDYIHVYRFFAIVL